MRRQQKETTVLHSSSSIALLQERFRQLQRVKEMREEKELRKAGLGLGTSASPEPHGEKNRPVWFCHPDLVRPIVADSTSGSVSSNTPFVGARYLGINSVNFDPEGLGWGSTGSVNRWCDSSSIQNLKNCSDAHDVDTSLHL